MKKTIFIVLIGLFIFSCQEKEPRTDYVINGTAKDTYNGIRVYLGELDQRGRFIPKDTAIVMNELFNFKGNVEFPTAHIIMVNGISGRLPFMLENSEINISINNSNILESKIIGSNSHDIMTIYNKDISDLRNRVKSATENFRSVSASNDSILFNNARQELKLVTDEAKKYPVEFIQRHKDNTAVLQIFNSLLQQPNADIYQISNTFESLNEEVKNTSPGKLIKSTIDQLILKLEREKATAIGQKAPSFSAPSPDGNELALADVVSKGKVTIIDFWAAWCGPCRRENPNVVKVYEEFHDKGLEIIGVSLDGRRGQKEPKKAWMDAIEKDGLTWHQVSNLQYFDNIAKSYNVNAIPAMFVLDENGVIIAKNLRGPALGIKIAELLN